MNKAVMSREQFLLWLAGFIDGDGTIGIGGDVRWQVVRLRLINTSADLLKYIQSKVGGHLGEQGSPVGKGKQVYCLTLSPNETEEVLFLIGPYLRLKYEQARLALEFQETKVYEGSHSGVPYEVLRRRKEIGDALNELNRRGV